MDLPNLHRREMDRPHTASNCQKFEVRGESLMASRSFKYFDQGQGVSAYTFVDERHFLWHSLMISAADRESAYFIDGLMCNDVVRSDIHSTDSHGCNEVVFGLTHLMGFSLASRIKGVGKQTLYIFRRLPESSRTWVTFRAICHDSIDVQQTRCILLSTTSQIYNQGNMELGTIPEFYIGSPVESVDLRFRDEFVAELWQTLRTGHVVLTAPRRTGKTSVMDYLRDYPENEFQVVSINVQDLTHPADFFQVLLDAFHDAHPDFLRDRLAAGWGLVSGVFDKVESIGAGDFKLALRGSDPDWNKNWRRHGDTFLTQARTTGVPILFIIDEFPDMLLNLSREDEGLLREFLAWLRTQRQKPSPKRDSIRWLVGGSVNLTGTLDAL